MDEMENLLAQLKAEYEQNQLASPSSEPTRSQPLIDNLLAEVKAELEAPKNYSPQPLQSTSPATVASSSDNRVLQDIQAEYREKERLERERQQQELRERRQRKRQALRQQAQEWLKKLNPRSEEGMWFEEFSYAYDNKLEAAIDYLEALRESHF
ncbi:hypothetical protein Ple7327_4175 [Pleurocapsa sp. PCC 7327]|uniref:salt stress protein, Slr1339 family n=1 Tax=Pleurocapsa sp. PCC 7327 TaxID=118163 RepID=UPI00029FBF17|nr:hypothetical protein [Pleurocapsa sp. PCC 7327]AFY79306.1 hypothetical protein Ple7327_4175 [Pleurocapsa sp. PCC 7327]